MSRKSFGYLNSPHTKSQKQKARKKLHVASALGSEENDCAVTLFQSMAGMACIAS